MVCEQRRKHKQTKHAVDDGRHGRQQLHRRAERAAQPYGAGFCQKECNAKCQRHGNQQCYAGAGEGADDGDRRTEFFIDDVPLSAPDELDAKLVESWPRVNEQRDDDAQQRHQHQQRQALGQPMENDVLQPLPLGNRHHGRCGGVRRLDGHGLRTHGGSHAHVDSHLASGDPTNQRPSARPAGRWALFWGKPLYFLICDQTLERICAVRVSGSGT